MSITYKTFDKDSGSKGMLCYKYPPQVLFFCKRTVSLGSLDFKIEEWTPGSGFQDSTGSEKFQNLLHQTPYKN